MPKQKADKRPKIVFCQFSDNLLTPYDDVREYYRRAYADMPGYVLPEHFMEIPYWIAIISGVLPHYKKELHIVTDLARSVMYMNDQPESTRFLFSVMDSSLAFTQQLASQTDAEIVAGGYVRPISFDGYHNVSFLDGLEGLDTHFPDWEEGPADYSLFRGKSVIPRLSLSTGCAHHCTFCTVPRDVATTDEETLWAEVEALMPLKFGIVYLDDKSFGQAGNWRHLKAIGETIRRFNPKFLGFAVQTSPSIAANREFMRQCKEVGVCYMEIGAEVVDDGILRAMKKPSSVALLNQVMKNSRDIGMPIIPNFIFGIAGVSYEPTVEWVRANLAQIPVVNGNWLAAQGDVRGDSAKLRGGVQVENGSIDDADQNSSKKSWLSPDALEHSVDAFRRICEMTAPEGGYRLAEARVQCLPGERSLAIVGCGPTGFS